MSESTRPPTPRQEHGPPLRHNPWHWVVDDARLLAGEKLVALVILRHQNADGRCWLTLDRISQLSGYGRRQVNRLLHGLERKDRLKVKRRQGRAANTARKEI